MAAPPSNHGNYLSAMVRSGATSCLPSMTASPYNLPLVHTLSHWHVLLYAPQASPTPVALKTTGEVGSFDNIMNLGLVLCDELDVTLMHHLQVPDAKNQHSIRTGRVSDHLLGAVGCGTYPDSGGGSGCKRSRDRVMRVRVMVFTKKANVTSRCSRSSRNESCSNIL